MRIKATTLMRDFVIHNEIERPTVLGGMIYEGDDPRIDIAIKTLAEIISGGEISDLMDWLHNNAEDILIKESIRIGEEKEARRKYLEAIYGPQPALPKRVGYVYLLHCPSNNLYKIGMSKDVNIRHANLVKQSPVDIIKIHSFRCEDALSSEKTLHDKYADKRAWGEWFKLDPNDINEILALRDNSL